MPKRGPDGKELTGSAKLKAKLQALQGAQAATRSPDFAVKQRAAFVKAIRGKHGLQLAAAVAEWAAQWCGKDDGTDPAQNRQQAIGAAQALAKVVDPQRVIEEQAQLLAEADRRIAQLEALLRAASQSKGDRRQPEATALQ